MNSAASAAELNTIFEPKKSGNQMKTKSWGFIATLLPSAALFALLGGCSSVRSTPSRVTYSQSETPVSVSRHETRSETLQDRRNASDEQRSAQSADADSPAGTASGRRVVDNRSIPEHRYGSDTVESQRDRVTAVSVEPPPPLLIETPARTIREDEFWVGGHWISESTRFAWQAGRIESDRPGELFAPAGWANSSRGWLFTPEYWR